MEKDYIKEFHDKFSLFNFLTEKKKKECAVIVITPHQLVNCKTTKDGEGFHSYMFSYIADRILPGKIKGYLESRDDVCEETALLHAGKILDDECMKCILTSNSHFGNVLAWKFPKSGTLSSVQFELLKSYLENNREVIERTGTRTGIVGTGDAITISELIEKAKSITDNNKDIPELYADEDIIGITLDRELGSKVENEQNK